jgi:hypothetical protein
VFIQPYTPLSALCKFIITILFGYWAIIVELPKRIEGALLDHPSV